MSCASARPRWRGARAWTPTLCYHHTLLLIVRWPCTAAPSWLKCWAGMLFCACHRLQAALSGAEAARRELEAAHSARGSEARATVAHTAEAAARAATLQRQLETERAQVAAAVAAHQEEVAALKVCHWTCRYIERGLRHGRTGPVGCAWPSGSVCLVLVLHMLMVFGLCLVCDQDKQCMSN